MTLPDTAIRAKAREIAAAWRNLIAAIESPSKWYTADELSERRAIPTEDGNLIAALSPANVAAFLDLIDALLSSGEKDGKPILWFEFSEQGNKCQFWTSDRGQAERRWGDDAWMYAYHHRPPDSYLAQAAEGERLLACLKGIAEQKLPNEMHHDFLAGSDWRAGYVGCVRMARAALASPVPGSE